MSNQNFIIQYFGFQLEQMELEVKDLPPKDRQKYTTRVKSYKAELSKLQKDNVGQYHKELSFLTYMYLFCLVLWIYLFWNFLYSDQELQILKTWFIFH